MGKYEYVVAKEADNFNNKGTDWHLSFLPMTVQWIDGLNDNSAYVDRRREVTGLSKKGKNKKRYDAEASMYYLFCHTLSVGGLI